MSEHTLVFAGSPIIRRDDLRADEDALQKHFDDGGRVLAFTRDMKLLADVDPLGLRWFSAHEVSALEEERVYLGQLDDAHCFAVALDMSSDDAHNWGETVKALDARSFATGMGDVGYDQGRAAIVGQAKALLDWHARHGFCAKCGDETEAQKAGYQRVCVNEACKAEHFPRTDPAVIMLAHTGEKCLLGRQTFFPEGVYSTLAGYIEPGENLEEAVRREILEESGVRAHGVEYVASQPWPFPSNLMIGCMVEVEDMDAYPVDGELEDVRWFTRSEVLEALKGGKNHEGALRLPPSVSIARFLVETWANGLAKH